MGTLASGAKPAEVLKKVNGLFDVGVVYLPLPGEAETLRSLAAARRMLTQISAGKNDAGMKLLPTLLENKALASALALSVRPEDDLPKVYGVLADLQNKFPKQLADEKFANLATAISIVYDKPPAHPVLARTTREYAAIDSAEVFNFFTSNSGRMQFPLATTPVELLINVVDVSVPPEEMSWALQQYAGNRTVGKLYDTITYDTDVLKRTGHDDKKIFKQPGGYTLQNIKKVGGVCEEQGFFSSQVGKCIGVPTVYVVAAGNETGHAYVGYLRSDGPRWEYEGQKDQYKEIEGFVTDPQTGQVKPYTVAAVAAMMLPVKPEDRQRAAALTDAAERLGAGAKASLSVTFPEGLAPGPKDKPRTGGVEDQLALLDMAVRLAPGYLPAWEQVVGLGKDKKLTDAAKRSWSEASMRVAGRQYPDFSMWVIAPLIRSMDSVDQQSSMWDSMSGQFGQRRDLAARCKFEQGSAWEKANNPDKAYIAYNQIIERYPNDGRLIVEALARIELMMTKKGMKADALIPVYDGAFRRMSKPATLAPEAHRQSSYYLVGSRLAELYEDVSKKNDAERVRRMIDSEKSEKKKGFGK